MKIEDKIENNNEIVDKEINTENSQNEDLNKVDNQNDAIATNELNEKSKENDVTLDEVLCSSPKTAQDALIEQSTQENHKADIGLKSEE